MFRSVVAVLVLATADSSAQQPPNFVFVLSDDVAQGDLGCYGQRLIATPRLDRMAAEGTRFLQAYCGTSVCAPSRASFFTGLHTGHCPIRGNYEVPPEGQLPLPNDVVTIAEVARSAGYATGVFGKWGMGFFGSTGDPLRQGVERFFGYNCQRHAHSYFPTYLFDNASPFLLRGNSGQGVGPIYAQELIQNAMLDWIDAHASEPFFLFYAITLPHSAHEIDDLGRYADMPWSDTEKAYAAQVTRLDSDVGALLDKLREHGLAERTLVVFAGDNGSSFAPDSELGNRFNQSANGLRGYKRGLYEGALRQAAIAWRPGVTPAARVSDEPWAFWDLLPTFVEMTGVDPPPGYATDGHSLVDYFAGGPAPSRDYFYWELHVRDALQAARFGKWKVVKPSQKSMIELYDLATDAAETVDLSSAHPEIVERARAIFAEAHRPDPNWPLSGPSHGRRTRSAEAWSLTRARRAAHWAPPEAVAPK